MNKCQPLDRVAFAPDASFYRLIPRAVVFPAYVEEVRALFRFSRAQRIPMTFRAAGTSLSGQAITDGILVEVARHWRGIRVLEQGVKIQVGPGVIGDHVNRALRPFLFPELTQSATHHEAVEVMMEVHEGYFSSSRTCEVGLTRATGRAYRSFIHLLDAATR